MKVKFKLPLEDLALLRSLSEEQGRSMTDVIRNGISTLHWMRKQKLAGKCFLVEHANGKVFRLTTDAI